MKISGSRVSAPRKCQHQCLICLICFLKGKRPFIPLLLVSVPAFSSAFTVGTKALYGDRDPSEATTLHSVC